MASKLKRYGELSQEDKDMVDSALASIRESSNRTASLREENQLRDLAMRKGRDYTETPGDKNEYSNEPYDPRNPPEFAHAIIRRKK